MELADELAAVVGLPSHVFQVDAATPEMSLDTLSKQGAGGGEGEPSRAAARFGKGPRG